MPLLLSRPPVDRGCTQLLRRRLPMHTPATACLYPAELGVMCLRRDGAIHVNAVHALEQDEVAVAAAAGVTG